MKKMSFSPIGIVLHFYEYEESEESDYCYEFSKDFFVSLNPLDMIEDLCIIEKMLNLNQIDRCELLRLIDCFQNGEVKELAELEATNGHLYSISPKYAYTMETCEEASSSKAGSVDNKQRLTLY